MYDSICSHSPFLSLIFLHAAQTGKIPSRVRIRRNRLRVSKIVHAPSIRTHPLSTADSRQLTGVFPELNNRCGMSKSSFAHNNPMIVANAAISQLRMRFITICVSVLLMPVILFYPRTHSTTSICSGLSISAPIWSRGCCVLRQRLLQLSRNRGFFRSLTAKKHKSYESPRHGGKLCR